MKNSGNKVKLSNILESSENEFSNIDSPEENHDEEEDETFGEISQGMRGSSDQDQSRQSGVLTGVYSLKWAGDFGYREIKKRFV